MFFLFIKMDAEGNFFSIFLHKNPDFLYSAYHKNQ